MNKSLLLILVSICLAVVGQILLKIGMTQVGVIGSSSIVNWRETLLKVIVVPQVWLGLSFYVFSAISWLIVLSRVDLSFAYPFVAVGYIAVLLISSIYLHENVPMLRWLGVIVICFGVILVARS